LPWSIRRSNEAEDDARCAAALCDIAQPERVRGAARMMGSRSQFLISLPGVSAGVNFARKFNLKMGLHNRFILSLK
jgi:hypothetical protein